MSESFSTAFVNSSHSCNRPCADCAASTSTLVFARLYCEAFFLTTLGQEKMNAKGTRLHVGRPLFKTGFAVALLASTALGGTLAYADDDFFFFQPGNLLLSKAVYNAHPTIIPGVTQLPPNCTTGNCVTAVADGTYPTVFNNAPVDGSFGVTTKAVLDELRP